MLAVEEACTVALEEGPTDVEMLQRPPCVSPWRLLVASLAGFVMVAAATTPGHVVPSFLHSSGDADLQSERRLQGRGEDHRHRVGDHKDRGDQDDTQNHPHHGGGHGRRGRRSRRHVQTLRKIDSCRSRDICVDSNAIPIFLDKKIRGGACDDIQDLRQDAEDVGVEDVEDLFALLDYEEEEQKRCVNPYCTEGHEETLDLCVVCSTRDFELLEVVEVSVTVACSERPRRGCEDRAMMDFDKHETKCEIV